MLGSVSMSGLLSGKEAAVGAAVPDLYFHPLAAARADALVGALLLVDVGPGVHIAALEVNAEEFAFFRHPEQFRFSTILRYSNYMTVSPKTSRNRFADGEVIGHLCSEREEAAP